MALKTGSRLGPYEVTGVLASGGMGEVYRARDPRLDRDVAIKILLEEITHADHLRRFEQEARTAGALNHPNVLVVYDVGIHEGAPYVVSELLEGQTLRTRLAGGGLPVRKAVEHALQIAHGLAAAHERGIVHRDLKPENVFLTGDGQVKILDFGLAKLERSFAGATAGDKNPTMSWETDPGTLLGTAGYMSPEQVRGQDVDHRSDIFSFGALLHETLSGQRAFRRQSAVETMNAILTDDPPEMSGVARSIPPALERIVHRCLEKRREDRFQSAHDLALAFEAVSSGAFRRPRVTSRQGRRVMGAVALAALLVIAGLWVTRPSEPPPPPLRVRPITSDPGVEMEPALSPDGHQVAFIREGNLYVKLIDSGEPLLLSRGDGDLVAPAWSPDGRQIGFIRHVTDKDGPLHAAVVMPALGGSERRLAVSRSYGHAVAWSPDGSLLAINDKDSPEEPEALFLLSFENGERRRLTWPPAGYTGDSQPRFSPDGSTLAFVRAEAPWEDDIYLVPVDGGETRRLTVGNHRTDGLAWTPDGRGIVFSSWRVGGAGEFCLWRVPLPGGEPQPLEFGENGQTPSISRDAQRLAYTRLEWTMDIWRVGGPSAAEDERAPTPLVASTWSDLHPEYSPDGGRIAFTSGRSGALEIWVCESDGSNPRQLTFLDSSMVVNGGWSPDGESIAFSATKGGSYAVYVVSASGGLPRRLGTGSAGAIVSSWSRDGRWVYFFSSQSGKAEVWKVPAEGGHAVQVTTRGGTLAFESHDARFLYFNKSRLGGTPGIWRIPRDGGEETKVLDWGSLGVWTILEQGILTVDNRSGRPVLTLFDTTTGRSNALAELDNLSAVGLTASPDGRWVLYIGGEREADIMLVEGFR